MLVCTINICPLTRLTTTALSSYIPLVMLVTWLDFDELLLIIGSAGGIFFQYFGCIFQGQSLYWAYLRNSWSNRRETKRKCISWILSKQVTWHLTSHLALTLEFSRSTFEISYLRNRWSDWCEGKRNLIIQILAWLHDLAYDHVHGLDLEVSRSKFEIALSQEWKADWHGG